MLKAAGIGEIGWKMAWKWWQQQFYIHRGHKSWWQRRLGLCHQAGDTSGLGGSLSLTLGIVPSLYSLPLPQLPGTRLGVLGDSRTL